MTEVKIPREGWELPRIVETVRFFIEITAYRPETCEHKG